MRLKTVAVEYQRKVNLGDFNSLQVSCGLWAELEFGDDESIAMHQLWEMAKANVKAQILGATNKNPNPANITTERTFLGRPVIEVEVETGE